MAKSEGKAKKPATKIDLASVGGLVVAAVAIVGGLILEGGKVSDISQLTAGLIVLGGTLGAVMINTPMNILLSGLKRLPEVFLEKSHSSSETIDTLVVLAGNARKSGIVSLEAEVDQLQDPFLKKALSLAVDGTDLQELRKMMEYEITAEEERAEAEAKVYESAGGYAPTIGIIGAVMGLIQVMKHLENIEEVGHCIAVAFVATVYGVAVSNIFFLPAANKLKARAHHAIKAKEMALEGVCSLAEGMNPKLIRMKLEGFVKEEPAKKGKESKAAAAVGTPATAEN
jgi:chemotaxis protein MotA